MSSPAAASGGEPGDGPTFLILGAQKAGTNSLREALARHPDIGIAPGEPHYFDLHHARGPAWYRGLFAPSRGQAARGESSPYYLFHPAAPERARRFDPELRLLVVLRDPVERLISHYRHAVSLGLESLPLAAALRAEAARLNGEEERLRRDPAARSFAHQHHSYRARGLYLDQLRRWRACFPRERLFVLEAGELQREPRRWLNRCASFLGLGPYEFEEPYPRLNPGDSRAGDTFGVDIQELAAQYREPNEALFRWWGRRADWTGV